MSSAHEFGARHGFARAIEDFGAADVYGVVELGRFALWCTEPGCAHHLSNAAIGQTFKDVEPVEQLWCRGRLEALLANGRVLSMVVDVFEGPVADREVERNQALLNAGLAGTPGRATVWSSSGGRPDDGLIEWVGQLRLAPRDEGAVEEAATRGLTELVLPELRAPLEIGYTLPSRTWLHLAQHGAVWRWPYRSTNLFLLAAVSDGPRGWGVGPLERS
ncbi:MAG: hypothetical protein ACLGIG_09080 [Actinomycetes bacterium]